MLKGSLEKPQHILFQKLYSEKKQSYIPSNLNDLDHSLKELLLQMLCFDIKDRLSMEDIKNWILNYFVNHIEFHEFFTFYFNLSSVQISKNQIKKCFLPKAKNNLLSSTSYRTNGKLMSRSFASSSEHFHLRKSFIFQIRFLNEKFSKQNLLLYSLLLFDLLWNLNFFNGKKMSLSFLSCAIFYISFILYNNSFSISFFSLYNHLHSGCKLDQYQSISEKILGIIMQILFAFSFDLIYLSVPYNETKLWEQNQLCFSLLSI